jgi:hypothetical protein
LQHAPGNLWKPLSANCKVGCADSGVQWKVRESLSDGEVAVMVVKSSTLGVGQYRGRQRDQELVGEALLLHWLLSTSDADELIADRSALQLAQHQLSEQGFTGVSARRRILPPRRHLRTRQVSG